MKLNEFIKKKSIYIDIDFDSKKTLFKEIGKIIEKQNKINSVKIIEKLNEREMLGSTGVGEGVAIPHAKVHGLTKGFYKGTKRILTCHPIKFLGGGEGFDPVKKKGK